MAKNNDDINRPLPHADHKRPITRRDFLGQGLIAGSGIIAAPSILGLFANAPEALAQMVDCGVSVGGAGKIPFLCYDLAGGASVAGSNVLVGGPLGQLDPLSDDGYIKLGLAVPDQFPNSSTVNNVNSDLGLLFHADSAFLRGILDKTTQATRDRCNGTVICARSDNDTGNNPHNPMYGIAAAGAKGELLTAAGTRTSISGGKSRAPDSMIDPALQPTKIDRPEDATGLVDTGRLVDLLDESDATVVMNAVGAISDAKLDRMNEDPALEDTIHCNYEHSATLVANFGNPNLLNPLADPNIIGPIFTAADFDNQSEVRKTGSIIKLLMNDFAGVATLEFGGYDYHNGTRSRGETKDFVAGQMMGAALEYARLVGKQLMLYVFSDGSVASDGQIDNSAAGRGKGVWRGDNSSTAAVFILVLDPSLPDGVRPALAAPDKAQIGYFRANGSVETASSRVANNVDTLAQAIVLNYLALHNEVGMIDSVLPGHNLGSTAAELDQLIAFAPIRNTP